MPRNSEGPLFQQPFTEIAGVARQTFLTGIKCFQNELFLRKIQVSSSFDTGHCLGCSNVRDIHFFFTFSFSSSQRQIKYILTLVKRKCRLKSLIHINASLATKVGSGGPFHVAYLD